MSYQFNRITVLVIEDNLPMLEVVKALLQTFGVGHVFTAPSGDKGYELFKQHRPDIIITDWMMKPVDGLELTKRIRTSASSPNPYVPIIVMTGFSEKKRVFEARDAGVTEFLVKPFNAKELYKRIVQVIERPRQFVRSQEFFGPDRRRKRENAYMGPFKRIIDKEDPSIVKLIKEQQARAQENLAKIRKAEGLGKGDSFDIAFEDNQKEIEKEIEK